MVFLRQQVGAGSSLKGDRFSVALREFRVWVIGSSEGESLDILSRCGTGDAGGLGPDLVSEVLELRRPEMLEDGVK